MSLNLKSDFTCKTCNKILNEPISVPCTCLSICKLHVDNLNLKTKATSMTCQFCKKKFDIPKDGFPENKMIKSLIEKEIHLSDEEKALKASFSKCFNDMDRLLNDFKTKTAQIQAIQVDHFVNLRKSIDVRRDSLIQKINQLSEETIKKVNESEERLKKLVAENNVGNIESDVQKENENLSELFRNPNIAIESIVKYKSELEQKQKEIQLKFTKFDLIKNELTGIKFETKIDFENKMFGGLNNLEEETFNNIITCHWNKSSIDIWDINTNSIVKSLIGHNLGVRFWDLNTGHLNEICCLKILSNNLLVSCSGDNSIKVWEIDSGNCQLTLRGHSDWVRCCEELPKGLFGLDCVLLASGSFDSLIKIWDLSSGTCIKSIKTNNNSVICLKILKIPNLLASGSGDKNIRIIDYTTGECIRILKGHSSWVFDLVLIGEDQIASCSFDKTIKTWNLRDGKVLKTLTGHKAAVFCLQINSDGRIVSGSYDNTFKIWDLSTGECIKTYSEKSGVFYLQACRFF